jgi:hypothetical protein
MNDMNLVFEVSLFILRSDFFTCRKILRHGADGFTSPLKKGVLRIPIAIKNPLSRPGLNTRTLGPMACMLTTETTISIAYLFLLTPPLGSIQLNPFSFSIKM